MGVGVGGMDGRGPAPFGGGGYVPGGGGIYCGARAKKTVNDKLIVYDTAKNARGICGIGDAAYIAGRWVGDHSAMNRQLLTLCIWWYGRRIRHWLHKRCRYKGTRWWGSHARHNMLARGWFHNELETIVSYLPVVVRNVNKTLFTLFVRVMGDRWRTGWRHVSRLLGWLVR